MTQHTLAGLIADARARMKQESIRGADWTFHQVMTKADRDAFDAWLVKIGHVLAIEPGTQEYRFKSFMSDLHNGCYKGEMP